MASFSVVLAVNLYIISRHQGDIMDSKDKNILIVYSIFLFYLSGIYIMNERNNYEVSRLSDFIIKQNKEIYKLRSENPKLRTTLDEKLIEIRIKESSLSECINELNELKNVYDENLKLSHTIIELESELGN